ncbi:hypothetical protein AWC38_SpisGene22632 [Stylophora pistillata]|uniref:Reverse transcriptase domain-containing protein n=1 Tax=Stylophora pistillata TaxID=50429 RepID=A0A2B4RAB0_STYPI|nr:hypothetical protein AWC38_SpisGene22632 [Stylophora pistillata]
MRSCTPPSSTTFLDRTNNLCAIPSLESTFCSPTVGNLPERRDLHIPPPSQLNIQLDTFPIGSINNQPVTAIGSQNRHRTSSTAPQGRNPSNISVISCRPRREEHEFGMNILLANSQSLAPKIDEVRSVMLDVKPDLGLDAIMPAVKSKVHLNDPPWITPEFKTLIATRQQTFMSGDLASFRRLRNTVNRVRKTLRERFFASKVEHLKNTKLSRWWREVKRIAGMTPASGSDSLRSLLYVEGLDHHPPDRDVANAINSVFLDQMKSFSPLDATPPFEANSVVVTISEVDVLTAIGKLNPRKAVGPDGIPSWVFREYADFIAQPVTSILNWSFAEQQLPPFWKL